MGPTPVVLGQLGISLVLGLLVGLQRQRTEAAALGMRTFPLISLLGTVSALLATRFGGWIVGAGLLAIVAVLVYPSLQRLRSQQPDPGITTDVAALLMYAVGGLLVIAPMAVAIAIGGTVALLLQFKPEMHRFAEQLGDNDLRAIMQFVLITCIILPVLPNATYGPLNVFNPFETWLMVVLIVAISLGGYIAYKFLGRDAGIFLGGVLGGALSSTATTASYARRTRHDPAATQVASIVIMIASTVVFVRVLVEIAIVAPEFLASAAPPIVVLLSLAMIPSLVMWRRVRGEASHLPAQENPSQLKPAILFALMYTLVLWGLAAARKYVPGGAVYAVAFLSGLTDMDAITLSTAKMFKTDPLIAAEGWRLIVVAALANLAFKAAIVGVLGGPRLLRKIVALFLIPAAGGVGMGIFWSP